MPKVEQRQSWNFSLFAYDDVSGWLKLICISKVVFITLHVIANLQNTYKLCKGKYHWTDDLLFDWFDFDKQVNKEKEAGIGQIKKALGKHSLFESINRQIGVTLVIQCSMYEAFQSKSSHRKSIWGGGANTTKLVLLKPLLVMVAIVNPHWGFCISFHLN